MTTSRKFRIAISGGGLAGAAIANSLFRHPHLDVQLYESAPEFSERGQAVGLAINAQKALARLVPNADELLDRAGAVPMNSARIMMGAGPAANTKILDIAEEQPGKNVHRAAFLRELLAPMPRERLSASKKLAAIDNDPTNGGLVLRFEDGSTTTADALIGADGIFGHVRSHVLPTGNPAVQAVPAGWAVAVNLIPFAKAREKLGLVLFKEDRQYGWIGPVQCIGTIVEDNDSGSRKRSIDRESLQAAFAAWQHGPIAENMIDILLDQDDPSTFAMWDHGDAPTYVRGRVCIAGDAAHAMTPWQGSGAAAALEDAVVLGELLGRVRSSDQIESAFRAYDAVRRPHASRVAASSCQTGRIMTGLDKDVGVTDPERIRAALQDRWDFIYGLDLGKHVEEAVDVFGEMKAKGTEVEA